LCGFFVQLAGADVLFFTNSLKNHGAVCFRCRKKFSQESDSIRHRTALGIDQHLVDRVSWDGALAGGILMGAKRCGWAARLPFCALAHRG
jgi:hypothetical protein